METDTVLASLDLEAVYWLKSLQCIEHARLVWRRHNVIEGINTKEENREIAGKKDERQNPKQKAHPLG
ncbi:hypothetical protein PCI56_03380 [Plesiomonas shigelloides subsp. oncorhynchi]|nr:hypothetical protein [Plesiomonas shigelloides]